MKIALVSVHIRKSLYSVPLGVASFGAALQNSYCFLSSERHDPLELIIVDYHPEDDLPLLEQIMAANVDCVAFSIALWNRFLIVETAAILRSQKKAPLLIAGGADITANSEGLESGPFDILIKGEGDVIADELAHLLIESDGIYPGSKLTLLDGRAQLEQQIKQQEWNEPLSPWLSGVLNPSNYEGVLWELSRGCPFKCSFCYESKGSLSVRHFSKQRIKSELALFVEKGVKHIFILDPTFNYNKNRAIELLELFIDKAPQIHYSFEARAELMDADLANLLSQLSCSLQIGLQSVRPKVLQAINRKMNRPRFEEGAIALHQAGVVYGFDLIYGLPEDNYQGVLDSLDFALSMRPNHLDIFPLSVLPGTQLLEDSKSYGLLYQSQSPYSMLSSPGFTARQMNHFALLSKLVDFFYNKAGAVTWFSLLVDSLQIKPSDFFQTIIKKSDATSFGQQIDMFLSKSCDRQENILFQQKLIKYLGEGPLFNLAKDLIGWYGMLDYVLAESLIESPHFNLNYDPMDWVEMVESGISSLAELVPFLVSKPLTGKIVIENDGFIFVVKENG